MRWTGKDLRVQSSFRDPSGHIFSKDGAIYRQPSLRCREDNNFFMKSGLPYALASSGLLPRHQEAAGDLAVSPGGCKALKPEPIPFVSWPYEPPSAAARG